jgi:SAM-dependent methyltransferase
MSEMRPDPATRAALARLYDVDLIDDPGDLDLYLALAVRTGGPILELGAGSGRLAIPLAEAGYEVTAVDIDAEMLARLNRRAGQAESGVRERIDVVEADLVGLHLPGDVRFKLAILALNSIMLLESHAAQQAAFETMARHLEPGGLAVVDVWLPGAEDLARYDGRLSLEYVRLDPETGQLVVKTASAMHEPAAGRVALTALYEEAEQGGTAKRWVRLDRLRLIGAEELGLMAESAGLVVEVVAGSYDLDPMDPYDERAIVVARKRGRARPATLL